MAHLIYCTYKPKSKKSEERCKNKEVGTSIRKPTRAHGRVSPSYKEVDSTPDRQLLRSYRPTKPQATRRDGRNVSVREPGEDWIIAST